MKTSEKLIIHYCTCKTCRETFLRCVWWEDGQWYVDLHTTEPDSVPVATIHSVRTIVKVRGL